MGSIRFPKRLLLLHLILFTLYHGTSIAQYQEERDALYALKHTFNDPFLNDNWDGLQCYQNTSFWFGVECVNGFVTAILLGNRGLSGKISADAFVLLPELITLSFKNNSLSGNIMDFSSNPKLKDIDLSKNAFDGPIPSSLLSLDFLQSLQLQENHLTGPIPGFNQKSLTTFNVSYNNIHGPIPGTNTLKSFGASSYSGNGPYMCDSSNSGSCYFTDTDQPAKKQSRKITIAAIFIVFDIIGLLAVILLLLIYCKKSRKLKKLIQRYRLEEKDDIETERVSISNYNESKDDQTQSNINNNVDSEVKRSVAEEEEKGKLIFMEDEAGFDLNDLLRASAEGLGKGIFGNSYKAKLEGRPAVVVKRLRDLKPLRNDEFAMIVQRIADQKHPNLLPLLAYYFSNDEKLFLSRYAKKGNLFNRLHGGRGTKDRIPLRWNSRLAIARGVARAMEYLHLNAADSSYWPVPHGNLKLTNVLLDENDAVLVSDYGLSSLVAVPIAAQRLVSYKSPEYQNSKRVSVKSDVWSFGCLLLEILTGRLSVHSAPPEINGVDLGSWVHRAVREEWTAEIFDMEISVQRSAAPGMLKLLQLAIRCCDNMPEKRPETTEIVREMDSIGGVESEDSEELSADQSLTDESFSSINASSTVVVVGNGRRW